jgi:hypothetical protein
MAQLSLYLVTRTDRTGPTYDSYWGFVVAAADIPKARIMCAAACGDEGPDLWADPERSVVEFLGFAASDISAGIVLRDFNAG